ncbi:hypothetical protein LTR36_004306 [Oleoguttula mirabilis]|uniref:F-box domain-containing protein n=1 Tax=Oleoguttula mirabilis TaxID=1507867 RepID=A0AAV9JGE4_9PEZI|nr:hypothetical protein LTR36_004306 [Oleoguttula mirabilis]
METTTVVRDNIVTGRGSMESPGEVVTRTAELLEMILLKLDMRTLLRVQRVSSAFHGTIHTSPELRRKLWISPRKPSGDGADDPKATRMLNPLILDRRHKLLIKSLYLWQGTTPTTTPGTPKTSYVDIHYPSLKHALALRSGSWCEMIVVQPHHASIQWSLGYYDGGKLRQIGYRFTSGPPTLGVLLDALLEHFVPGYGRVEPAGEEGRVEEAAAAEDGA